LISRKKEKALESETIFRRDLESDIIIADMIVDDILDGLI